MQEHITDHVSLEQRKAQLALQFKVIDSYDPLMEKILHTMGHLVAMAYEAGRHQLQCGKEPLPQISIGYGSNFTDARAYAKDKGLLV